MKLLVLSDSHGDVDAMIQAVDDESPEMLLHLGDCWRDVDPVMEHFPELPFFRVPGNCDFRPKNHPEQTLALNGFRILLCHGHTYGVKQGLWEAEQAAQREKADVFLYGHTHIPKIEWRGKILFFNPGSVGLGCPCTYGVLNVEKGRLDARVHRAKAFKYQLATAGHAR